MKYAEYIASQYPALFTIIGFALAGGFFWLRERIRIVYAAIEIIVGLVAMYDSMPIIVGGNFDQSFEQINFDGFTQVNLLTIFGAIYLIVRGFDNLDKSLKNCLAWKAVRVALRMDHS